MPAILDTAIGVIFIFLLFSLIVTALNEFILCSLDRRAAFLREGIKELFRDTGPQGQATLTADAFFQHGLIAVLSRKTYQPLAVGQLATGDKLLGQDTRGVPSYIPGKSFVLALLGLLTQGENPHAIGNLRPTIEKLGNLELKNTLLALYDDADGKLDHFKANLENWFNENMDRVGGWYKRNAQKWLLGLSLGLAVLCNVDSIRIIESLSLDPKLRDALVQQAITKVKTPPATEDKNANPSSLRATYADLADTGIPLGWGKNSLERLFGCEKTTTSDDLGAIWLTTLAGWIITGLAASLGAPFWFDLLNRFIDIRGVGRAPEESDTTGPKKPSSGIETYLVTGNSLASTNSASNAVAAALPAVLPLLAAVTKPAQKPRSRKPQKTKP